ncbi:MAG: ferritin family protein [Polyangiales bacterium]
MGGYLRRAAWLEAQAEGAFDRLTEELTAHGGPDALVRAARRSAREEARHAERLRALCDRRGLRAVPSPEAPRTVRPLADVAIENATEGCAGETWGALLAMHQAATARDPEVRAAMTVVARDEARHAALAWAVHRWALETLDDAACGRVERAADEAWDALERAVSADPPAHLAVPLGLPDGATALRLARALRASLRGRGTRARRARATC